MAKLSDEPESDPRVQNAIEVLVSNVGLRNMIFMLGAVCVDKAGEHKQAGEATLASLWDEAGRDLARMARRVKVLR